MKDAKPTAGRTCCGGRLTRRAAILLIVGVTVITLALALGIGLGLGLRPGNESGSGPSPTLGPTTNGTLWQPGLNSTWQIILLSPLQLSASASSVTPDVAVFDIDLFDNNASAIQTLRRLRKSVICYFSAGSYEPNRPDSSQFQSSDFGQELQGWRGEKWLNLSSANVRSIMSARIQLASQKGCDAVDPDNVDGYQNDNGLGLTANDSINFMQFLSTEAGKYNISVGLKNALDIIPNVVDAVHFAVNEQCVQYRECDKYSSFTAQGKPVFHIEYPNDAGSGTLSMGSVSKNCDDGTVGNGSTVLKGKDLNGWVQYCDGSTATTPTS